MVTSSKGNRVKEGKKIIDVTKTIYANILNVLVLRMKVEQYHHKRRFADLEKSDDDEKQGP